MLKGYVIWLGCNQVWVFVFIEVVDGQFIVGYQVIGCGVWCVYFLWWIDGLGQMFGWVFIGGFSGYCLGGIGDFFCFFVVCGGICCCVDLVSIVVGGVDVWWRGSGID